MIRIYSDEMDSFWHYAEHSGLATENLQYVLIAHFKWVDDMEAIANHLSEHHINGKMIGRLFIVGVYYD